MTLTQPATSSRKWQRLSDTVHAQLRASVKANCGRSIRKFRAAIERGVHGRDPMLGAIIDAERKG